MTRTTTPVATKKCPHCKVEKVTTEFGKDQHNPDHLASWCKACMSAYRKAKRAKPAPVPVEVAQEQAAAAARATQNAKRREQRAARKAQAAA